MKKTFVWKMSVLTVALCALLPSVAIQAKTAPIVLAYYTPDTDSYNSLKKFHASFNQVSTDTFNTDAKGNLVGDIPTQAVSYANSNNLTTYALVSNYGATDWDPNIAHKVLTNTTYRAKLINNMFNLVKNNNYKGINVDFEGFLSSDRDAYTSFVKDVAAKMKAAGYKTMVSVPAKSVDDPNDSWSYVTDYDKLGQYADYIQVMTYDEHGTWSDPGSVSSKPWIESSLAYAVAHVPANKVIMGIPEYGNDWNLTNADQSGWLNWKDVAALLAKTKATPVRDTASGSMKFTYKAADGSKHEVWYEDATSIKEKTHYTITYGIAGVSVYALGHEDANFWAAINAGLQP
ncbi:spore protein O [Paenibacillus sp. SYP-B3998]|uniref:Spore protein O n=1 Tax=Paenibacillus sp. SYP-B3998 TaxID=2678564 RepID=A0A6G3ZWE4_9BACL|nr:glycosyl hydrolase family 18 protein [Paenibacillus sp. SYP-B3998]NEW06452.1 spore protein O [Paenibacillus sp. SYP-B3998]